MVGCHNEQFSIRCPSGHDRDATPPDPAFTGEDALFASLRAGKKTLTFATALARMGSDEVILMQSELEGKCFGHHQKADLVLADKLSVARQTMNLSIGEDLLEALE